MQGFSRNALLLVTALALAGTASAQQAGQLYGINHSTGGEFLATIDKSNAAVTTVGTTGFEVDGLAFHLDGRLFAADNSFDQIVTLDPSTGQVDTVIGPYVNINHIEGLAFHPLDQTLWAIDNSGAGLARVDTTTGEVTAVGPFGISMGSSMAGLSWSADGSALYAMHWSDGGLYQVDPATGLATIIGHGAGGSNGGPLGLAADPVDGQLYTAEWRSGTSMTLARVDPTDGSRTPVGTMTGANQIEGLTFTLAGVGQPYCSTNANSTGSAAAIWAEGSASLAEDDLTLISYPVPDQVHIFIFGPSQAQVPFGNGNLCIDGGVTRILPPQVASGNVAQVELDLTGLGILPGVQHFQCWFRDPNGGGAGFNTSSAVSITFVP